MCLDIVFRGIRKKEALAVLPDSGYYWKTVNVRNEGLYYPVHQRKYIPFDTGNNETKSKRIGIGYKVAFHLYRNKKDAEKKRLGFRARAVIRCKAHKKHIVAIGWNSTTDRGQTIVTKRFWMPKPKKKPV